MKIIDFESKKNTKDNGNHDSILDAFEQVKQTLEDNEERAEAMVCFIKTNENQYYNSVVVNYGDLLEMIGLVDVMKLTLIDAVGD